jgi:hypothetical protein
MMNSELWALEWSHRANVFHVQRLDEALSFNRRLYQENTATTNDYRILLMGTKDECENAAEGSRHTLQERESRNGQPT